MWIELYLLAAVTVAIAAWLVSPRFRSFDTPTDITRAFWSTVAGALWPLVVVGAVQILAIRYLTDRLRPGYVDEFDLMPQHEMCEVGVPS